MASSLGGLAQKTVGSLDTVQGDDNTYSKHILEVGQGESSPVDSSECTIYIYDIGIYKKFLFTFGQQDRRKHILFFEVSCGFFYVRFFFYNFKYWFVHGHT